MTPFTLLSRLGCVMMTCGSFPDLSGPSTGSCLAPCPKQWTEAGPSQGSRKGSARVFASPKTTAVVWGCANWAGWHGARHCFACQPLFYAFVCYSCNSRKLVQANSGWYGADCLQQSIEISILPRGWNAHHDTNKNLHDLHHGHSLTPSSGLPDDSNSHTHSNPDRVSTPTISGCLECSLPQQYARTWWRPQTSGCPRR